MGMPLGPVVASNYFLSSDTLEENRLSLRFGVCGVNALLFFVMDIGKTCNFCGCRMLGVSICAGWQEVEIESGRGATKTVFSERVAVSIYYSGYLIDSMLVELNCY